MASAAANMTSSNSPTKLKFWTSMSSNKWNSGFKPWMNVFGHNEPTSSLPLLVQLSTQETPLQLSAVPKDFAAVSTTWYSEIHLILLQSEHSPPGLKMAIVGALLSPMMVEVVC